MCTAISFSGKPHLFGRNLDLDRRYGERIICHPRRFSFPYRYIKAPERPLAFFGAGAVVGGTPLFYDAVNERGLYAAGLNFPESASYAEPKGDGRDLAVYELIPFILSSSGSVSEAERALSGLRLIGEDFSEDYPAARLHFFIADEKECIAAEPLSGKIVLTKNPAAVLTNEPPLALQLASLYERVPEMKGDRLTVYPDISASPSSEARFIRSAVCAKMAERAEGEKEAVNQLFHVLSHAAVVSGTAEISRYHKTVYTSAVSHALRSYHYSTYENPAIKQVVFTEEDFDSEELIIHPMIFD